MAPRRCLLVGIAALPIAFLASPAAAASDADRLDVFVDRSAWSWRQTLPSALPVDEPSRVPEGGLAVASDGDPQGRPGKATYLHLDLGSIPLGTRVDALTVTLPLDPDGDSSNSTSVRLLACRLLAPFSSGEGVDPADMPEEDCAGAPTGGFDPEAEAGAGAWTFTLTALAQEWVADPDSNHGFVVRPPQDYLLPTDMPFQLAFEGAPEVRVEVLAEVPVAAGVPVPAPVEHGQAAPPAVMTGAPPAFDSGVAAPVQPPVALAPPVPTAAPLPPAAPAVVPPARGIPALSPPRTTTGALWSLGALAALLLVGVSRVAGNTAGPYALARLERQRLDRLRLQVPVATSEEEVPLPAQLSQIRQGRRPMSSAASISR